MLILVTGGSCSGKSSFAESLLDEFKQDKYYIATMAARDSESLLRIERHQKLREGKHFQTVEQSSNLAELDGMLKGHAMLECMSNLVANEMFTEAGMRDKDFVVSKIVRECLALAGQLQTFVIVTNNVFEDGGNYDPGTMQYLQALGEINTVLAKEADRVYEVMVGIPVLRKGESSL